MGDSEKLSHFRRDAADDLFIVPRSEMYEPKSIEERTLRVAGYSRVSTLADEQETSLALQEQHFRELLQKHGNWRDAGQYADEGISGTSRNHRDAFNRMIDDCKAGKIDMIVTKSISRLARNALDCLGVIQELNELRPKVGVMFEVEGLNTFHITSEMILTVLAAYAQEESHVRSEAMLWSIENRFRRKIFLCPTIYLLGYETVDRQMVIEPEGAKTVRLIFGLYLAGFSTTQIASQLTCLGRPTGKGNLVWSSSSVRGVLRNEKMCGDVVAQKSHTISYLSHKSEKNLGYLPVYYDDSGHHEGIVSREDYVHALLKLFSGHCANPYYELAVIRTGLLRGFIPMNRAFGGYEAKHYVWAAQQADSEPEPRGAEFCNLPGYEVVRMQDIGHSMQAMLSVTAKSLAFNKVCVGRLPGAEYAEVLLHPIEKLLAIRPTTGENPNAIPWRAGSLGSAALCKVLFDLMGWHPGWRVKLMATNLSKNDESVLLFDLRNTEFSFMLEQARQVLHPGFWKDSFGPLMPQHAASCRWHRAMLFDEWQIDAPAVPLAGSEHTEEKYTPEIARRMLEELCDA